MNAYTKRSSQRSDGWMAFDGGHKCGFLSTFGVADITDVPTGRRLAAERKRRWLCGVSVAVEETTQEILILTQPYFGAECGTNILQ